MSYKDGQVVEYGTPGSVRVDTTVGPVEKPIFVCDLKTGKACLTPKRIEEIQKHLPGGKDVPVIEIKPK